MRKTPYECVTWQKPKNGSDDDRDPAWLMENTTLDQIEQHLAFLLPVVNETTMCSDDLSRRLFTDWEVSFFHSVNTAYERKHAAGFHDRPLTGKQLFYLRKLLRKLALDTETMIHKEAM